MSLQLLISGIIILLTAVYLGIIFRMTFGIWLFRKVKPAQYSPVTKVTVIVPARNEEKNILNCLQDLRSQNFPDELFDVILVDDGSTDRTALLAGKFEEEHPDFPLRVMKATHDGSVRPHKKEAIKQAVSSASGQLILTTDADTRVGAGWISSIVAFYETERPKMILGPVAFHREATFFSRVQSVEFLALMTATAGLCRSGMPVMCNSANLAYEKDAFFEAGGYDDDLAFPSGDDMFLMSRFRKRYGAGSIQFLWDVKAIVWTEALSGFRDFWHQRVRWVSKNKGYHDFPILFTAIVTYLVNVAVLCGLIAGIFNFPLLALSVFLVAVKALAEFPAVFRMAGLAGKRSLLWLFPVVQLLNILYVSVIGLVGNFLSYTWKERKSSQS